ncbi:MAG: hypothetical protein A3K04_11285 [Gallionellales bacterium RBG_16_56_9]|nr:MAG: hypothetical protein A3K04_11285 [Gallionellales bacterium RBG_16_56_9]
MNTFFDYALFDFDNELLDEVVDQTENISDRADGIDDLTDEYANYMKGTFRPVEGSLVSEAMKDPTAEAELAASEAGAGVDLAATQVDKIEHKISEVKK